jgi:non-ribosomal peptide synthetase component E (peptide arylation enzyme)
MFSMSPLSPMSVPGSSPGEPFALVFEERRYTLAQLDALAGGLAASLSGRGVTAGARVACGSAMRWNTRWR